jgi:cell division septation protein DedD
MNRVSVYQLPIAPDTLSSVVGVATVPPVLIEPLQALVAAVTHRSADVPVRLYVCADDDAAASRDAFAFVLAKSLSAHVPSTLVVDCDFLKIGLSGIVPQPDALGLLDFLLYGSSIGVVTQESPNGVRVVGAGSFPVTKRMPFVTSAFEEAARRLAAHARCAIFVGPLVQEDGSPHPLTGQVNVAVVMRTDEGGARTPRAGGQLDAIEETIASGGVEVWSVRTSKTEPRRATEPAARPAVSPPPPGAAQTPPVVLKPKGAVAPSRVDEKSPAAGRPPAKSPVTPRPSARLSAEPEEPRYSTLLPRIAVLLFALLVIGFVGWWFWQGRSNRAQEGTETSSKASVPVSPVDTSTAAAADESLWVAPDTVRETNPFPVRTTEPIPPAPGPARVSDTRGDTGGGTGGTVLVDPSDILVMDDLARRWNGWYAIHISSFQESIRAREEVAFLQSREFPVFIVFLDLGPKGKWYRVYAGPFETREQARDVKKNLDAIPQVRFTRVTRIPE